MTHAIRVHEYGGPEVLRWEEVEVGDPGPGQIRIRQTAVGLNYIDVYLRTGLYPQETMPFTPGMEGAGVITAVGKGVRDLKVGRRVAYAGPVGAYAIERLIAADRVVVPDPARHLCPRRADERALRRAAGDRAARRRRACRSDGTRPAAPALPVVLFHA